MVKIFLSLLFASLLTFSNAQIQRSDLDLSVQDEPAVAYNPLAFETKILNYSYGEEIRQLERLEIGITLPLEINHQVLNFVRNVADSTAEKRNPYLEWELKVEASFIHEHDTLQYAVFCLIDNVCTFILCPPRIPWRPFAVKNIKLPKSGK